MTLNEFLDAVDALPVAFEVVPASGAIRARGAAGYSAFCDCPIEALARVRGLSLQGGVHAAAARLGLSPEDTRCIITGADVGDPALIHDTEMRVVRARLEARCQR